VKLITITENVFRLHYAITTAMKQTSSHDNLDNLKTTTINGQC